MKVVSELWAYRNLTYNLAQRELKSRYKKSLLGWLWSLLNPAAILAVYTLVFGYFFSAKAPLAGNGRTDVFALYLFAGLWVWNLFNGKHMPGENFRVFPLNNWTELDIWTFIAEHNIDLPSIYYAHRRPVFRRDNMWMAVTSFLQPEANETVVEEMVRFRTVGDATCTAAIESVATTVQDIIAETSVARVTERGATRADDRMSEAGMEDRKRTGYF